MQRNHISLIAILIMSAIPSLMMAEAPSGYYASLKGKSESALKTALYQIINPHTQVSSYTALPEYFKKTDVRPGTNYWWDMYSDLDVPTNITFGTYMNREHSLPKSWWGGLTNIPAYVDLFHLYPGEAKANQAKSNYPLGEIKAGVTPKFTNGISQVGTGVNSGGAPYVFEPANEYKGDFARTYFYMVTCYQNLDWKTTWQVANGTYPSLQPWSVELLLKWHRADPVSQKEINRNEAVYKIQNNRNPFIDDPDLVEYIWGNKKGQAYTPQTEATGDGELYTPVNGMYLDMGQVALGNSTTSQLIFRGKNITGTFDLLFERNVTNNPFSISTTTVPGTLANSTSGTYVTVTYKPTTIGTDSVKLYISGACLEYSSYIITLRGECLAKPTLSQLTATEATNITPDSYVARWEQQPADEVVDYYMVTVKRYKDGVATTFELPAETDSLLIDGLNEGDYDTYAVQSVRLEERSPISNYVTVKATSGIEDILADEPLAIESGYGFLRFRCSMPQTGARIYDIAGRILTTIPEIYDGLEVELPTGVYLIVTDSHARPVKTIVR